MPWGEARATPGVPLQRGGGSGRGVSISAAEPVLSREPADRQRACGAFPLRAPGVSGIEGAFSPALRRIGRDREVAAAVLRVPSLALLLFCVACSGDKRFSPLKNRAFGEYRLERNRKLEK